MTERAENHKTKGLTVEGFWRRLKDQTETKDGGPERVGSGDLGAPMTSGDLAASTGSSLTAASVESHHHSERHDDWIARFDDWLDKL